MLAGYREHNDLTGDAHTFLAKNDPMREINEAGINLIKSFDGKPNVAPTIVKLDCNMAPIQILTNGWGHAISMNNRCLKGTGSENHGCKLI